MMAVIGFQASTTMIPESRPSWLPPEHSKTSLGGRPLFERTCQRRPAQPHTLRVRAFVIQDLRSIFYFQSGVESAPGYHMGEG